jgi:hypothetical protein
MRVAASQSLGDGSAWKAVRKRENNVEAWNIESSTD